MHLSMIKWNLTKDIVETMLSKDPRRKDINFLAARPAKVSKEYQKKPPRIINLSGYRNLYVLLFSQIKAFCVPQKPLLDLN